MSRESDNAYRAAQAEIARAKDAGDTRLDLGRRGPLGDTARHLLAIPPEIAELKAITGLHLSGTQVSDLTPIAGLTAITRLRLSDTRVSVLRPIAGLTAIAELDLSDTQVSDLTPIAGLTAITSLYLSRTQVSDLTPIAGLIAITGLDLDGTQVSDLTPVAGLTAITRLDLTGTQVSDLTPIAGLRRLTEGAGRYGGLRFSGTPAIANDPRPAEIAAIEDDRERALALSDYLGFGWREAMPTTEEAEAPRPPTLPAPRPAALETEIRNGRLVRLEPGPPLPPGAVNDRAAIGWQAIRDAREDFAGAVNLDNYRAVKAAVCGLDRAMGADYALLNQIAVGLAGQRLARLATDVDLLKALPDGSGAELAALAASVEVFANRFPIWRAYLADADAGNAEAAAFLAALNEAREIGKVLDQAGAEVAPEVRDEFLDEVELARENPTLAEAARAALGSTAQLLRVLAEDALASAKAVGIRVVRGVIREAGHMRRIVPDELRKKGFWAGLGVTWDIYVHNSRMLLSLADKVPHAFGWVRGVLQYFGLI